MNWSLLQNSLLVSGLTTFCSLSLGFIAALGVASLPKKWQAWLLGLAVLALVLPPFLVTNCWLDLLGQNGVWRSWLPLSIYSLGGTVWILTLLTWPITLLAALSAWRKLDAAQLECEPGLSGLALIRWLLWPVARPLVGLAAVLTFVLALNNFAVPAILQVKVFPAEAWIRYYNNLDIPGTLAVSWPLIIAPLIVLIALHRTEVNWPAQEGPATARALRRQLGTSLVWSSALVTVFLLALAVGLPLAELVAQPRTWAEIPKLLQAIPGTIWNSFALAALSASAGLAIGWATWRWRIGLVLWLLFLTPGVLLGIAMILLFNRSKLQWIYSGPAIVVLAWTIRYLAVAWHGIAHAFRGVDRDLTDAARLDGASGWTLLRQVHWPQVAPQMGVAWYVTYVLCLWDVETLVLIMPPGGETLAYRIFNSLHYGHTAQVNAMCVLLLGLAMMPIAGAGLVRVCCRKRNDQ